MSNLNEISRRSFIKTAGLGSAAATTISAKSGKSKSKVIITRDSNASKDMILNQKVVTAMVDKTVMKFTGKSSVGSAFESLFPNVSIKTRINLKVNMIAGSKKMGTHPEIVEAIVHGLAKMCKGKYPRENIAIWCDRNKFKEMGYPMDDSRGYKIIIAKDNFNDKYTVKTGEIIQAFTQPLIDCDYFINVPILKDHGTAGVTGALKNHYGSVSRPREIHDNCCDPFISEIYSHKLIKEK
ncbi:MAG: DUF362 domain-containing protein, partial [bacterium]